MSQQISTTLQAAIGTYTAASKLDWRAPSADTRKAKQTAYHALQSAASADGMKVKFRGMHGVKVSA